MKSIKLFVLFLFIILPINSLSAQNFSLSAGANHSWLTYPDEKPESSFNPNYSFGVTYYHNILQSTNLSVGLRLFNVGRYAEITTSDIHEEARIEHMYLAFPIKAEYELLNNFFPFINIEPAVQLQSTYERTNLFGVTDKGSITNEMNTFNVFTGFGIKYVFNVSNQEFSISSMMNFGLLRISENALFDVTALSERSWHDWKAREFLVAVEYYINL